jgi:hypothetical protein
MRGGGAESARGAGAWVPTPIQHRPLFTPVQPGSGGRNRTSPVDFALVGGPWAGTRWCEQAPAPSLLGPPVTAPPRPKSGRARTRPHPVGTGPASVRVRGPGLPPVGPERPSEWAADRGGGGPGPPRFMPQIGLHTFFSRVQGVCRGLRGGGEESARCPGAWVPTPSRNRPRFTPVQGDPSSVSRSGAGPRGWQQLVRAATSAPLPRTPGYCPSGTEVGASADPTSPRRNQAGIGPCETAGPTTCRTREAQRVRGGWWWGGPLPTPWHASNHPINAHIHFFLGCRACAGACKGGGRRALTALVLGCRPPPGTDHALPRFRGTPALYLGLAGGPVDGTSWSE